MKELFELLFRFHLKELFLMSTQNNWIQLFRYCFVGTGAFLVDFGCYCLLAWLGLHYLLASLISFLLGFAFNFSVSRYLIFSVSQKGKIVSKEVFSVLFISVTGLFLTQLLLYLGTELFRMDFRFSKIIASVLVLFWNYAARKMFVYHS